MAFPLLVLALAALVYALYGFDGVLLRDYSIYLYSGQRVAEGVPPYVGVFDHKGPLSPLIAGFGVVMSGLLNVDDVYAVRLVFYVTACLTVVAVYLLGKDVFRSREAGLFAALTFLGFYAYAQPAASGPEPKTPMVLFQTLSLLLAVRKKWFWSGFSGSLAFLVWQPMAAFAFVTFLLAITRPREERYGAALRTIAGGATPFLATVAYFYYHGALYDFLDGFVLFNFLFLERGSFSAAALLGTAASNIILPYSTMLVPILIGLVVILRLYFQRPFEYRFLPILLSFPAPVLWSLRDFQLADDFYVFLPYAAIGFGGFLAAAIRRADNPRVLAALLSAILLTIALANTWDEISAGAAYKLTGTTIDLPAQRGSAGDTGEVRGRRKACFDKLPGSNGAPPPDEPRPLPLDHGRRQQPHRRPYAGRLRRLARQSGSVRPRRHKLLRRRTIPAAQQPTLARAPPGAGRVVGSPLPRRESRSLLALRQERALDGRGSTQSEYRQRELRDLREHRGLVTNVKVLLKQSGRLPRESWRNPQVRVKLFMQSSAEAGLEWGRSAAKTEGALSCDPIVG